MMLSLLFAAAVAFADQEKTEAAGASCVDCVREPINQPIRLLEEFAATDYQVRNAACMRRRNFTEKEMTEFLMLMDEDTLKTTSKTSYGIAFKDERPGLLELFEKIHQPSYGHKPLVLKSKCDKVLCAMNEIYGKPKGTQLLFMMGKFGYNGSRLANREPDDYSPWQESELDELLLALESLPPKIHPISDRRQLLHYRRGYIRGDYEGKGVIANSMIQVFDRWNRRTREDRLQTIIHEVAHVYATEKDNLDISPEWLKIAGWEIRPTWRPAPRRLPSNADYRYVGTGAPSQYAKTGPYEDFAESVAAYRYNSRNFKRLSPARYEFIKEKVFNGLEYINDSDCERDYQNYREELAKKEKRQQAVIAERERAKQIIESVLGELKKTGLKVQLSEAQKNQIMKRCMNLYIEDMASDRIKTSAACFDNEMRNIGIARYLRQKGHNIDARLISSQEMAHIPVDAQSHSELRSYVKTQMAEAFNKAYLNEVMIQSANTDRECDENAKYFWNDVPAQFKDHIYEPRNNVSLQTVVAKACKEGLKDFGGTWIYRKINPFAKNPFTQVFH